MGVTAEGILRGCQGLLNPVSLGYPLLVFNKNSTLKRYFCLSPLMPCMCTDKCRLHRIMIQSCSHLVVFRKMEQKALSALRRVCMRWGTLCENRSKNLDAGRRIKFARRTGLSILRTFLRIQILRIFFK